ncbi:TadE/TadG family type IV pilus assembly protein [Serinicoccus chungangensis]|uniref:TadE/TadG family type IV pilus assembly protein n=1 Tax=Serinicoccus chungangensis TaxID=767452 RepID=UPI001117F44C|nr:TadE/TadG family type IV pilus assembly protein [Serinicoccus chungangensis]
MKAQRERGAAAVEFALVALMLITLVFGAAEFGRLWFLQSTLAAAARDGAREMAVKNDQGDAQAAAQQVFPGAAVAVTPATGACDSGGQARVVATYDADWMTGLFGSGTITLTGEGVMRCGG